MTIADILNIEDNNSDRIYLFHEGAFLKAYEHSAFLFHRYVSSFKLSYRFYKNTNRYVISLGFPKESAKKVALQVPCGAGVGESVCVQHSQVG